MFDSLFDESLDADPEENVSRNFRHISLVKTSRKNTLEGSLNTSLQALELQDPCETIGGRSRRVSFKKGENQLNGGLNKEIKLQINERKMRRRL